MRSLSGHAGVVRTTRGDATPSSMARSRNMPSWSIGLCNSGSITVASARSRASSMAGSLICVRVYPAAPCAKPGPDALSYNAARMLDRRVIRDLEGQVAASHVYTRPADLAAYAYDAWGASGERELPAASLSPASTEEVAGIVSVCAVHRVPIVPRGAGTGYAAGASPSRGGVILSLARLNRVLGVEPEAMRLHAQAGAITAGIHKSAAATGLYYPPDPGSSTTSTIGGNVA